MTKEYSTKGVTLHSSSKKGFQQFAAALQAGMEIGWLRPVIGLGIHWRRQPGLMKISFIAVGLWENDSSLKMINPCIDFLCNERFLTSVLSTLCSLCLAFIWFSEFLLFKKIFLFSNHRHWSVVYFIAGNTLYAFYLSSGNHHNGK